MQDVDARLEDWGFFGEVLYGKIYGDKKNRWPDGHFIRTSRFSFDGELTEGCIIKTKNSTYLLGKRAGMNAPTNTTPKYTD